MNRVLLFLRAYRLLAQANLLPSLLFGAFLAGRSCVDWGLFVLLLPYSLCIQGFIVFGNDLADEEVDRLNHSRTLVSGGSGVLASGALSPSTLKTWMIASLLGVGLCAALALLRSPQTAMWIALSPLPLWLYSFPPMRASYRGFGELFQGIGTGVFLPVIGLTWTCPNVDILEHSHAMLFAFVLGCASNLATSLPDLEADKRAKKRTLATRIGLVPSVFLLLGIYGAASFAAERIFLPLPSFQRAILWVSLSILTALWVRAVLLRKTNRPALVWATIGSLMMGTLLLLSPFLWL